MGRLFAGFRRALVSAFFLVCLFCLIAGLGACGGHKPPGQSVLPGFINLSPAITTSVQMGATLTFTATAQNASGSPIGATFTFTSSNPNILSIASNGVACAGKWDAAFTTCTPQGTGVVQVTASALGGSSPVTLVFVHPPVDKVTVAEYVNTTPPPLLGPCFAQGQSITLQASAFSQGTDVTASVGEFTWTSTSSSVVALSQIKNQTYNIPTNQAVAKANIPGIAQIYASIDSVTSTPFQQVSPNPNILWDFFETCPVQNITLQLGPAGTQQSGQTNFSVNKGTAETVTAIVTDVQGNILTNVPLNWSASQSGAVSAGSACATETCSLGISPGAGTVTASCSPPTCNIGYPLNPPGLATYPQYVPLPVYATTAISGIVSGAPASTSVLASSFDCATTYLCNVNVYDISTSKNVAGNPLTLPTAPNSFLFAPAASSSKVFIGSAFGAATMDISKIGSSTSPFTSLGGTTGKVLAASINGNVAVYSDTVHTPNQVYIIDTTNATSPVTTGLNIDNATVAAFSPDGLKAYIAGTDNGGNPTIFVYSALQALQSIPLPAQTTVDSIEFSPNGAFAYVITTAGNSSTTLTAYNTCDKNNSVSASQALLVKPTFVKVIPNVHLEGKDPNGVPFPDGVHIVLLDTTGFSVVTLGSTAPPIGTMTNPATTLCPQAASFLTDSTGAAVEHVDLHQGTFTPVKFFVSPDGSQVYVLASDLSLILDYSFSSNAVSGIPLAANSVPITGDVTVDGTLIYVAGSDGTLHEVSTTSAADLMEIPFPPVTNFENPFCSVQDVQNQPCELDFVGVKP
jgi:hypothetical protein